MADNFTFDLVSPAKVLFSEPVKSAVIPGSSGYFTVYANHAPTISTLSPGIILVETENNENKDVFVKGGFIDVTQENVTLLAEDAKAVSELTKEELEAAIDQLAVELEASKDEDLKIKIQDHLAQLKIVAEQISN